MADFRTGQRVRTTIHITVDGGGDLPTGSLDTVTSERNRWGKYGVLLDGDPYRLPASFNADEVTSVQ